MCSSDLPQAGRKGYPSTFTPPVAGPAFAGTIAMRNLFLPTILFTLATALPAQVGQPMPSLEVDTSYNFDAFKLKRVDQLRGSVVFLEYWQTW